MAKSDLLAAINAEIEAEKAKNSFPKFPEFSRKRESQPVEIKHFPEIPGFPANFEEGSFGENFLSNEPSRAHAINKDARAKPILSENSGKTGNPYFSILRVREIRENREFREKFTESDNIVYLFEERAAIREYEGGFSRPMAQSLALDDCINELTGYSQDRMARDKALAVLRAAGIAQPVLFHEGGHTDAPF